MSFNVIFIKSIYGRESFEIIFREGGGLVKKIITVKLKGNFIFKSRKTFIYKIFKYKTKLLIFFIIEIKKQMKNGIKKIIFSKNY